MLTNAPLPRWRDLARGLIPVGTDDAVLAKPWLGKGERAGWLSRSAWSLALIALWRQESGDGGKPDVWLPDFICDAPLEPLRLTGARLIFYPVNRSIEPDYASCREMASGANPDIFFLVHYFGRPSPGAPAREFAGNQGAWLVEDAAHILLPGSGAGSEGDFVLYSVHKHLAIPDGALLVVRTGGSGGLGQEEMDAFGPPGSWPHRLGEIWRRLRQERRSYGGEVFRWQVKRGLQKLGVRKPRLVKVKQGGNHSRDQRREGVRAGPAMSKTSRRMLKGMTDGLWRVREQRRRNLSVWDMLMAADEELEGLGLEPAERPSSKDWTPYLAAFKANSRGVSMNGMARRGLPVTTWPDLPPEVRATAGDTLAEELQKKRLYLPVHQGISAGDLASLAGWHKGLSSLADDIEIAWDCTGREEWQGLLTSAGRSNILQSWAYGEARAALAGARVRRAVFRRDGEPVAIAQVLEKRLIRAITLMRINRGPLFLGRVDDATRRGVLEKIASLGAIERFRVLSFIPGMKLSAELLLLLEQLRFRLAFARPWESIWIDLSRDQEELRAGLDGKWRNMLSAAERHGLELEEGDSGELFGWMMERYAEVMQEKNFTGPSVELISRYRSESGRERQPLILRAIHEGEPVAGICLALHGTAATYLLGWNGSEGRRLKANQFLLWQATVILRSRGMSWLDLGGINEDEAPGIASFKLGMNGSRYELPGAYWHY